MVGAKAAGFSVCVENYVCKILGGESHCSTSQKTSAVGAEDDSPALQRWVR
jgi:hypothetical protein